MNSKFEMVVELPTLAATQRLAVQLAEQMKPPLTMALIGNLGAGKTQLIRFLSEAAGIPAEEVTSPTYVLLQRYRGKFDIYHFDFYRLSSAAEAWDLGIDELYEQNVLIVIEWADKFPECMPEDHLRLMLEQVSSEQRMLTLSATGPRSRQVLETLNISEAEL